MGLKFLNNTQNAWSIPCVFLSEVNTYFKGTVASFWNNTYIIEKSHKFAAIEPR